MGRKYKNPPVFEALCEVFFAGSSWDDTVPGRFYDRVRDAFPEKRQLELHQAEVSITADGATAGVSRLAPRMQFQAQDGARLIQLGRDLLVVNQLRPYPQFEAWVPTLDNALTDYEELCHPESVAKIGVRYLNRVELCGESVRLEDYFTVYPTLPATMGEGHGAFLVRFEVAGRDPAHTVVVTFATAPPENPGTMAFLLDLYDIFEPVSRLDTSKVRDAVREAHDNVEAAFEASITDALRALFEEGTEP